VVVEALRSHDVLVVAAGCERLELRDGAELAGAVHAQRALAAAHAQLDRVAGAAREPNDVDCTRGDGPQLVGLAHRAGAIRRLELPLDGVSPRSERRVSFLLVDEGGAGGKQAERERGPGDIV